MSAGEGCAVEEIALNHFFIASPSISSALSIKPSMSNDDCASKIELPSPRWRTRCKTDVLPQE